MAHPIRPASAAHPTVSVGVLLQALGIVLVAVASVGALLFVLRIVLAHLVLSAQL
ncbi:hypothetical protein [Nocardioides sp.]|uniref:hypothetical protein n=1 Tax=Nocardioides sp. TaxID=35761 RepID=UPI003513068F